MVKSNNPAQVRPIRWTPRLIRRLRGARTRGEFAVLLRVAISTLWRWESRRARPDDGHVRLLSELAERERFFKDWRLAGSGTVIGDIDVALRQSSLEMRQVLDQRAKRYIQQSEM